MFVSIDVVSVIKGANLIECLSKGQNQHIYYKLIGYDAIISATHKICTY